MNSISVHFELSSKPRTDNRHDIMLRFCLKKKMRRISTKIYVYKKDFSNEGRFGSWVKSRDAFAWKKNKALSDLRFEAECAQRELEKLGLRPTLDLMVAYMKGIHDHEIKSFIIYFEKICLQLRFTKKVNTYKKYATSIKKLRKFLGGKDLTFQEFSTSFLMKYEAHLVANKHKTNTVTKELKILRAVLYRAIKEDLAHYPKNPFFGYTLKNGKTNKIKLTQVEIEKIENLELQPGTAMWDTRNFFLFSYYCFGIRFADFTELKWSNIKGGRLEYQMGKTEQSKSIPIHPRVEKILEYYRQAMKSENDFIFPLLENKVDYADPFYLKSAISSKNTIVNKNLKILAKLADISKTVSFHIARHSFADVARSQGVDLYSISKSLGHSSLNITERYLTSLDQESVDKEVLEKMFN